ncbi:hypothetical protein QAD02_021157 [Eretmocerus hayati]|uniref:Uncharacterized protein n=1 Tax=Eretmocerus hayati TaxID=131215 RepID=A0ACC2PPY5_9HYME|nr:hypothetical protein QAD02_021157 [Eretmocerus hayati]
MTRFLITAFERIDPESQKNIEEVEVVPEPRFTKSIEGEEQKVRWPPTCTTSAKLTRLIKSCATPGEEWQTLDYDRILIHAEDYEDAMSKAEIAEHESDVEGAIAELNDKSKRSQRHKKELSPSTSEDDSESYSPPPPKQFAMAVRGIPVPTALKNHASVKLERVSGSLKITSGPESRQSLESQSSNVPDAMRDNLMEFEEPSSMSPADSGRYNCVEPYRCFVVTDLCDLAHFIHVITEDGDPEMPGRAIGTLYPETADKSKESSRAMGGDLESMGKEPDGSSNSETLGESSATHGNNGITSGNGPRILSDETLTYTQGYLVGVELSDDAKMIPKTVDELLALNADERFVHSYRLQLNNMRVSTEAKKCSLDIVRYLKKMSINANVDRDEMDDVRLSMPSSDYEKFIDFDKKMKGDAGTELRGIAKDYLRQFGGISGQKTVRSVMEKLMDDSVAIRLNLRGKGAKDGFEKREFYFIVCELAHEVEASCTELVAREFIGNYLKQTRHRGRCEVSGSAVRQ